MVAAYTCGSDMSLEARMRWSAVVLALGGLLVAVVGLGYALHVGDQAEAWRSGEPVRELDIGECWYDAKSGALEDCNGTWTTADGQTHSGEIVGNNADLHGPESVRAYGDAVYTKPPMWVTTWGLSAPYAGGVGLLLLVIGFVLRPSKAKQAEVRSGPLPAELQALAHSRDLGDERARYWKKNSLTYGVFVFEHGFVSHWPKEEPAACRWDEVLGVFERFVRHGREVKLEYLVWPGGEGHFTFREEDIKDIKELGAVLTECVAQQLRPRILAALQRSESYEFPICGNGRFIEFTPQGVGGDDGMIPWEELTGVDVQNGRIVIRGVRASLVRSWNDIGNPSLLVGVLRAVVANRQATSAPPAP